MEKLKAAGIHLAISAVAVGIVAVVGGLAGSLVWDTPSGPSIVVAACFLFIFSCLIPAAKTSR